MPAPVLTGSEDEREPRDAEAMPPANVLRLPIRPRVLEKDTDGLRQPTLGDAGMATAEYAIATLAAVGLAAVLVAILSSGEVRGLLLGLVTRALSFG